MLVTRCCHHSTLKAVGDSRRVEEVLLGGREPQEPSNSYSLISYFSLGTVGSLLVMCNSHCFMKMFFIEDI